MTDEPGGTAGNLWESISRFGHTQNVHLIVQVNPPPFRIGDDTVLVTIHVREEFIQLGVRDGYPGLGKRSLQFGFVEFAVIIAINALKKGP